ncbi:Uncharacterised protein [Bordetella pertussis]|nr:Uncharacterised protein [Bordetella pertussis]
MGVPLGVVTANATLSAPSRRRATASRAATSSRASDHSISRQPGSAAPRGLVRLSGRSRRWLSAIISGAARPLAHRAPPVGWPASGVTATSRPFSTWLTDPQRDRHSVQYPVTCFMLPLPM